MLSGLDAASLKLIMKIGPLPDALDPVALYGPCRDGGLDKGTLAMTLSGLPGAGESIARPA